MFFFSEQACLHIILVVLRVTLTRPTCPNSSNTASPTIWTGFFFFDRQPPHCYRHAHRLTHSLTYSLLMHLPNNSVKTIIIRALFNSGFLAEGMKLLNTSRNNHIVIEFTLQKSISLTY